MSRTLLSQPSEAVIILGDNQRNNLPVSASMHFSGGVVELAEKEDGLAIAVTAGQTPLRFLALRWNLVVSDTASFLGDAWERSYGDLQWRSLAPARLMPWYFLMRKEDALFGFGVKVRPAAFAQWRVEPDGITLLLDLRNGRDGVHLGGRRLDVATVITEQYSLENRSALAAAHDFCLRMCTDPLLPDGPIVGANNWYYAYGEITRASVLADCQYLKRMTEGISVKPFMVIDDGWQAKHSPVYNGGPWDSGNADFPDLGTLPAEMASLGVRPGIWLRPLLNDASSLPDEWHLPIRDRAGRIIGRRAPLDPSRPEVLELVQNDLKRLTSWGFQLIKHDFTTYDLFSSWGFQMGNWPLDDAHSGFHDQSRTAAEIVLALYQAIYDAAGNALILGCNTIGHLSAGLVHLSRTGDDTSGYSFDRTRRMGVNTLAFRLCQHNAFFALDADCVGILASSKAIPWACNRQWAHLLAASGTAFFTSVSPGALTPPQLEEMRQFYRQACSSTNAEPLDWLRNNQPEHWRINGREIRFNWFQDSLETSDIFA